MAITSANERQVGGEHYKKNAVPCPWCGHPLQHWDIYAWMPYLVGYLTKYLWRWRDKGGIQDLEKARHILDKLIEKAKADGAVGPYDRSVEHHLEGIRSQGA